MPQSRTSVVAALVFIASTLLCAQSGTFRASRDHAAIRYSTAVTSDVVARLNHQIESGTVKLTFEAPGGYLKSVLNALAVPVSSQTLAFSENSLQREHINKAAPRAIYFNDTVAVGWARGADSFEVSVQDPTQGVIFYTIAQKPQPRPQLLRKTTECLECHQTSETLGVPGLFAMSVLPLSDDKNDYAQGWGTDHRTPIEDRWGGWYVTGAQVPAVHLGNVAVSHVPRSYVRAPVAPRLATGSSAFDASGYLTPHSDIVALLVFNHQLRMTNLLTRLGWEARIAAHDAPGAALPPAARDLARDVVDYLLFVDEAPLPSPVRGSSGFAQEFSSRGPRDTKGRSLRDLDLTRRLLRYPCSYMIYTDAFDALPPAAKSAVYDRMWEVLSGKETNKVYAVLSPADRRAIIDILRETKKDLPSVFK